MKNKKDKNEEEENNMESESEVKPDLSAENLAKVEANNEETVAGQEQDDLQKARHSEASGEQTDQRITELEAQIKEWQDKFLRKAAEFENFKRRTENDQINLINYAAESIIIKFLPIVDDIERSLSHINEDPNNKAIIEGIKLVYEKLMKTLNEQGVKKMKVKGEPFNVDFHDALMQKKDSSVPSHTVLEEIESGYLYRDKVIRHAKVIVSEELSSEDFNSPDNE